jgi:hypothetical protein
LGTANFGNAWANETKQNYLGKSHRQIFHNVSEKVKINFTGSWTFNETSLNCSWKSRGKQFFS